MAICPGEGEATPVRCPGGGDAFSEGGPALELASGEVVAGEDAADALGAVPGVVAGDAATACAGDEIGAAAPCAAGLLLAGAAGDPSCAGARAPIFAKSCPIRIFPRNTGRSKM